MSGLLKGPLPLLALVGGVFLAYKYLPFEALVDRFERPVERSLTAPNDARNGGGDSAPVASVAPAAQSASPPESSRRNVADQVTEPVGTTVTSEMTPQVSALVPVPDDLLAATEPREAAEPAGAIASRADPGRETEPGTLPQASETPPADKKPAAAPVAGVGKPPDPAPRVAATSATQQAKPDQGSITSQAKPRPAPARDKLSDPVAKVAPATPPPAIEQPLAGLVVFAAADVDRRAGLEEYTAQGYAKMLRDELIDSAAGYLGADVVRQSGDNLAFRGDLEMAGEGIMRLCERSEAERLLLADLTVDVAGFSTVASAYWPHVEFMAINCAGNRLHKRPKQRLEPHRLDRFPYQYRFAEMAQQFVASQAYFLKP